MKLSNKITIKTTPPKTANCSEWKNSDGTILSAITPKNTIVIHKEGIKALKKKGIDIKKLLFNLL